MLNNIHSSLKALLYFIVVQHHFLCHVYSTPTLVPIPQQGGRGVGIGLYAVEVFWRCQHWVPILWHLNLLAAQGRLFPCCQNYRYLYIQLRKKTTLL